MRSGELARLTGVSADTLRHYERLGILQPSQRTAAGYRNFEPSAVDRVQTVQRALQLGFSLNELSDIFRTHDHGGVPCRHVLLLAEKKLCSLVQQIRALQQTEDYMRNLIREWRKKVKETPQGSRALLLQSIKRKQRSRLGRENLKRRLPG